MAEQRSTYPIPVGYRMLRPGEIIKENDLYWHDDKFTEVPHTAEYTGGADPGRHSSIIRIADSVLNPDLFCYG